MSLNNVKALLRQHFFLVTTVIHASTWLMYRCQQRGECLQEFNFKFTELIQTFMNHEPKDITDLLKFT